jgi:hypothetical protein
MSINQVTILCGIALLASCAPRHITDSDKRDLVQETLAIALGDKRMPDYHLLEDTGHVIVSTENIRVEWLPGFRETQLIALTLDSIQTLINTHGDVHFLQFDPIGLNEHGDAVVTLRMVWATKNQPLRPQQRDQFISKLILTFYRHQNRWKARAERHIVFG